MEAISLDRASAIKMLNEAFTSIKRADFLKAQQLFKDVTQLKKIFERNGRSLWTEGDQEILKRIAEKLLCQANGCVNHRRYQTAIDLCILLQELAVIIGNIVWTNVFYIQGVAYERLGKIKNARTSFGQGAFSDPQCKMALERIRREMAQR